MESSTQEQDGDQEMLDAFERALLARSESYQSFVRTLPTVGLDHGSQTQAASALNDGGGGPGEGVKATANKANGGGGGGGALPAAPSAPPVSRIPPHLAGIMQDADKVEMMATADARNNPTTTDAEFAAERARMAGPLYTR